MMIIMIVMVMMMTCGWNDRLRESHTVCIEGMKTPSVLERIKSGRE